MTRAPAYSITHGHTMKQHGFAFVGIQLAWNLRPFLARRDEPYALFRNYEGNFYTAVVYSVQQLLGTTERNGEAVPPAARHRADIDTTGWLK